MKTTTPVTLRAVSYGTIAPYKAQAARDRVSVSDTKNTQWYMLPGQEGFGALLQTADAVRVKGVYVFPEYRGEGLGTALTEALIRVAIATGKTLEVLAYNPGFYESRGFERQNQLPNGAWRLTV